MTNATQKNSNLVVLKTVVSKSNINKHYEIRLGRDNVVYCTCPAWKFCPKINKQTGRAQKKNCKHLTEFRASNPEILVVDSKIV